MHSRRRRLATRFLPGCVACAGALAPSWATCSRRASGSPHSTISLFGILPNHRQACIWGLGLSILWWLWDQKGTHPHNLPACSASLTARIALQPSHHSARMKRPGLEQHVAQHATFQALPETVLHQILRCARSILISRRCCCKMEGATSCVAALAACSAAAKCAAPLCAACCLRETWQQCLYR